MVGGFEPAVWPMLGVWPVVEATVGERSAQAFVEEQEEQGDLNPFGGKEVGVACAVALQEAVPFEFAQIVAKLVKTISSAERWKVLRTAWWISLAVQPPT